jgi:hypothetical protein
MGLSATELDLAIKFVKDRDKFLSDESSFGCLLPQPMCVLNAARDLETRNPKRSTYLDCPTLTPIRRRVSVRSRISNVPKRRGEGI